jgi:long-subunit fatty acid transport protein
MFSPRRSVVPGSILLLLCRAAAAPASTELPSIYDGRSVGMGGTGVAHLESGSALFYNPALMDNYGQLALTLDISPFSASFSAPFRGEAGDAAPQQLRSERNTAPLFFAGGGYRLSDRLVVGLGAYVLSGITARYEGIRGLGLEDGSDHEELTMVSGELALPVSFRLSRTLAVGASLRVAYAQQTADLAVPVLGSTMRRTRQRLSGTGFPGVTIGARYRPGPRLAFGLVYRSRVDIELAGETDIEGLREDAETRSGISSPHLFSVGAAYFGPDQRYTIALDASAHLFADSSQSIENDIAGLEVEQELDWVNSYSARLGGEYRPGRLLALRTGLGMANSATARDLPSPFFTPASLLYSLNAGAGLNLGTVALDLGGWYAFGGTRAEADELDPMAMAAPGRYSLDSFLFALSMTYRR